MNNTREQVRNYVKHMVDLAFLSETMQAAPTKVQVAVSTTCNLACPFCLRESMGIRENKFMDFEHFKTHIDELRSSTVISLFGLGEPFLHPEFFKFVELCKQHEVAVTTSSHGMSLDAKTRERIVEIGLDDLHLSMDGATKETFEWLRKNAIFETVVENVTALAALKKQRGASAPAMNVNMTVSANNIREVPLMVALAHKMGCDSVSYSSMVAYKPEDEHLSVVDMPVFEKYMEKGRQLAEKLGLGFSFWRQKAVGYRDDWWIPGAAYGCGQLNGDQIIERDGRMKYCCYIEEDIDNVFERGPRAAFNGEAAKRARRHLMEGRVRTECKGCLYLRERTPFWIQSVLNTAARITEGNVLLTEEDRAELRGLIEAAESEKNRLYPGHRGAMAASAVATGDRIGGGGEEHEEGLSEVGVY